MGIGFSCYVVNSTVVFFLVSPAFSLVSSESRVFSFSAWRLAKKPSSPSSGPRIAARPRPKPVNHGRPVAPAVRRPRFRPEFPLKNRRAGGKHKPAGPGAFLFSHYKKSGPKPHIVWFLLCGPPHSGPRGRNKKRSEPASVCQPGPSRQAQN